MIHNKQRGAALIIGLIFLVLMSVVGLSSLQNVNIQERISGNSVDNNRAMQTAEFILASAERDIITNSNFFQNKKTLINDVSTGSTAFTDTQLLNTANWVNCIASTAADPNPGAAILSKCITVQGGQVKYERVRNEATHSEEVYRVSVRFNSSQNTNIILQSTYKRVRT